MVFDPTYPSIDKTKFQEHEWNRLYGDVQEAIPNNCPKPLGREVYLHMFIESGHVTDETTRKSRTGYFIYMNSALVNWISKKQATIETSVFGAEFVAMKQRMEAVRVLRYKLRIMGVQISGPTYVYGDNMSVIHNTQHPESTLRKKSDLICYHAMRESVAMGESLTGNILTVKNCADLATKIISGGQKRDHLVGKLLFDIVDRFR